MPQRKHKIYFSYAWKSENHAQPANDQIIVALYNKLNDADFTLIRNKNRLDYITSITDFLKNFRRGDCIVLGLSDNYLRAEYCMFEFYNIFHNIKLDKAELKDMLLLVPLESFDLDHPVSLMNYLNHWIEVQEEWEDLIDIMSIEISGTQQRHYDKIRNIVEELDIYLSFFDELVQEMPLPDPSKDQEAFIDIVFSKIKAIQSNAAFPHQKSDNEDIVIRQINTGDRVMPDEKNP